MYDVSVKYLYLQTLDNLKVLIKEIDRRKDRLKERLVLTDAQLKEYRALNRAIEALYDAARGEGHFNK